MGLDAVESERNTAAPRDLENRRPVARRNAPDLPLADLGVIDTKAAGKLDLTTQTVGESVNDLGMPHDSARLVTTTVIVKAARRTFPLVCRRHLL